ncbi:MAG: BTAD domain-containing putative transcriptional regulator, partial [Hyphomicrobiaceae bacterium]
MQIHLIGKPKILAGNGAERPVPGHQPWAVLARLLCAKNVIDRRELAAQVFADVEDPLGALRWCLASLRKATGPETLQGDPIALNLPPRTYVDVWNIESGDIAESGSTKFLEGVEPTTSVEFGTWLMIEREHIASEIFARLRREAMRALSAGAHDRAKAFAKRAVTCRPLDESGHIVLVKCMTTSGDIAAAVAHVDATEEQFLRETGEKPSPALRGAARKSIADAPHGVSRAATIDALIKSGKAAVSAGAVDAGLDCLRRAAEEAEMSGERHLLASALLELGTSLIHAVRGFDDEGALALQNAADIANDIGSSETGAKAFCELGYSEALAGRRPLAANYLNKAMTFARGNDDCLASINAFTGFNLVDWGQIENGVSHYYQALEHARIADNRRREIWTLGIGSWGVLRAGRPHEARDWLIKCLDMCDDVRWLAFRPWAVAMLAEVKLTMHEIGNSAQSDLEEALALSNQLG